MTKPKFRMLEVRDLSELPTLVQKRAEDLLAEVMKKGTINTFFDLMMEAFQLNTDKILDVPVDIRFLLSGHTDDVIGPGLDHRILVAWDGSAIMSLDYAGVMWVLRARSIANAIEEIQGLLRLEQEAQQLCTDEGRSKVVAPEWMEAVSETLSGLRANLAQANQNFPDARFHFRPAPCQPQTGQEQEQKP